MFVVVGVFVDDDDEDVEEEVEEVDAEEGVLEKDICSVSRRTTSLVHNSGIGTLSPRRRRWYGWTELERDGDLQINFLVLVWYVFGIMVSKAESRRKIAAEKFLKDGGFSLLS